MLSATMSLTLPVTAVVPGAPKLLLCVQEQYPCMHITYLFLKLYLH